MKLAPKQPRVGETILTCGHDLEPGHTLHWWFYDPPLKVSAYGESNAVRFLAVCERCRKKHETDPLAAAVSRRTWGGEATIMMPDAIGKEELKIERGEMRYRDSPYCSADIRRLNPAR